MNCIEQANEYFEKGFNCCQSTFTPFGKSFGLDESVCLKMSAGFGGGMCIKGETCGVVVGAYMALGLEYGHIDADDQNSKEQYKELINKFIDKFEEKNGSTKCKELLGVDISTEEGYEYLKKNEIFKKKCPALVDHAAEILTEII